MEFNKYKLGDISTFSQGKQVDVDKQYETCLEGMKRFVRIVDYTNTKEPIRYVENFGERYYASEDDLVMIRYGSQTAGMAVMGMNGIIANNLFKINLNREIVLDKYMYYYLSQKHIFNYLRSSQSSSTMPAISFGMMKNLEINIPSIEEQKKIIKILDNITQKIEINNMLNEDLYEIGKTYYNYYFKKYDFTDELKESELGMIPKDYEIKFLSEVTTNNRDKVKEDKEYKVLSAVKTGNLELSEEYFNKNVPSEDLKKYIIVKKDDFAYNPARINIGSIGRNEFDFKSCVSPVYVSFTIENEYKYFWDFYFKDTIFNEEVKRRASGSVRQTLKYDDFGLIKVAYPNKNIVQEFNKLYGSIDRNIKQNIKENDVLNELRNTLLPMLINGKINLEYIKV